MGGVFQPAVLQSVQEMLFFWLAPLFVGWGGRGHVAGMQYPAIRRAKQCDPLPCHAEGSALAFGFPAKVS